MSFSNSNAYLHNNSYAALADRVSMHNYLAKEVLPYCENTQEVDRPKMKVDNGNDIVPKLQVTIKVTTELSKDAQHGFVFNNLKTRSSISIGQLCDDDCIAIFSKYHLKILNNDQIIITGRRSENGFWDIPLQVPSSLKHTQISTTRQPQANGIIR